MPFTGVLDGDIVWPDDVSDGATVACPECGDDMHVRSGHTTVTGVFKPRCFSHNPDSPVGGMCPGGESDKHKLMKYITSRRMQRMFDHATVERERDVPGTTRRGDVVAIYDDSFDEFGCGVVAEVQYRNKQKDIEAVTQEYLRAGFSVYWLNESHFGEDFEQVDFPDIIPAWPNGVPTPGEWTGVEEPVESLCTFGSRYPIDVTLPREYIEEYREELKLRWRIGSKNFNFDVVRELTNSNASRSCSNCGNPASFYLLQHGVMSTFRCPEHLPGNLSTNDLSRAYGDSEVGT